MKKGLLFLFLLAVTVAGAQDTIVRTDSVKIIAKVLTIDKKTVAYQRVANQDGPTYVIYKNDIARITYRDGFTERFDKRSTDNFVFRKNIVSVTVTDAISGMATLNYERIFWNDIGIRVQASRGILAEQFPGQNFYVYNTNYYYSRFKPFSVGVDLHYYVRKSANVSYYVGAGMELGQTRRCWGGCFPIPTQDQITEYYMAGLTNGISLRNDGPVSLDLYATFGYARLKEYDYLDPAARLGFNVGYRF
jgi:hypothetical protein